MTIKHFAKTSAYAVGMLIFPVRPKQTEQINIDEQTAAVQSSFASVVKDNLK